MNENSAAKKAGEALRQLISENYARQADFAEDFGADERTVGRYINEGINKVSTLQELSVFFNVDIKYFFK